MARGADDKPEKIRVQFRKDTEILVHNDLSNAAYHFEKRVAEREAKDDREGIAFDIMAGIIMVAFTVEAELNFFGWKAIPEWTEKERKMSFKQRTEAVRDALRLPTDWGKRPLQSTAELMAFRDELAHGKPVAHAMDEELVVTHDELFDLGWTRTGWEGRLTSPNLMRYRADVRALWEEMLGASGLAVFDTLTRSSSSTSFIEHVPVRTSTS